MVVATGARPRPLSGPGAELDGVRPLATLPGALALREVLDRAGRLAVPTAPSSSSTPSNARGRR